MHSNGELRGKGSQVLTDYTKGDTMGKKSLFSPAQNDQAYAKISFYGTEGSGKTHSASLVVIGLHNYLKERGQPEGSNPILFADTETGSGWVKPMFDKAGIEMEVNKTRAFKILPDMIWEAEERKCILLIDSLNSLLE